MATDFEHALAQRERALELVMRIDGVRDSLHDDEDPRHMFDNLALLLLEWFEADACAILLLAETNDDLECLSVVSMTEDTAVELGYKATRTEGLQPIQDARWKYVLGIQIILDEFPMGGLVLARDRAPFSEDEQQLIILSESQLDSAVVQARTIWKLTQRNHELEAIYEIDRLRDRISHETDLISGFTAVVLEYFQADFCLLLLTQMDSGEMVIRGIIDNHELSSSALDEIREKARQLTIPQVIPTPAGAEGLHLLAAPFAVAGARLGAVVIGRESIFTVSDHRLLHAMMSQMDSAVVYTRILYQLSQRKKELETIYKIDRIRDQEKDFDKMLHAVLIELCEVVSSDTGYIMLYNEKEEQELELRAFTVEGQITEPRYLEIVQRVSRQALTEGEMVFSNEPEDSVRSIVAVPLILNERVIGVFGMVNSTRSKGFDAEDRRMLSAITSQVDTAIFERLEQRRMRMLLSRSVDPKVVDMLLQKANLDVLTGERVIITVLFADLRESTQWAERTKPEELVKSLNMFLSQMTEVIFKYGGTLDKFVGDEVIGLFGTPVHMPDHAYQAARAAMEMQTIQRELQAELRGQGHELPPMGIGVSSGEAIAGEFGHPIRSEFTALGRIVNLGSRLCGIAGAGQVLISQATYQAINGRATVKELEAVALKGISHPTPVYELISMK
jgi:class 3 adenylate cyclase/putative methionine-R-sulfoxide reductase with GAF domain